jgi:hypothetical protein
MTTIASSYDHHLLPTDIQLGRITVLAAMIYSALEAVLAREFGDTGLS